MVRRLQADTRGSDDGILKRHAFRIVVPKPCLGRVFIDEYLQMVSVTDFLARVDVNPDRHRMILAGLAFFRRLAHHWNIETSGKFQAHWTPSRE